MADTRSGWRKAADVAKVGAKAGILTGSPVGIFLGAMGGIFLTDKQREAMYKRWKSTMNSNRWNPSTDYMSLKDVIFKHTPMFKEMFEATSRFMDKTISKIKDAAAAATEQLSALITEQKTV